MIDASLPSGWTVTDVTGKSYSESVDIYFTLGRSDTYATLGEKLFEELKKDATGEIKEHELLDVLEKGKRYSIGIYY